MAQYLYANSTSNIPLSNNGNTSSEKEITLEDIDISNNSIIPSDRISKKKVQIIFVGDTYVGKTSLFRRWIDGTFTDTFTTTIGVEYYTKEFELDNDRTVTITSVDICSFEKKFENKWMYKECSGAFVVFSFDVSHSFDSVESWKSDIEDKCCTSDLKPIPCVLIGNKADCTDCLESFKTKDEIEKFAADRGFIGYFETSAKNQTNIDEPLKFLINYIIDNHIEPFVNKNYEDPSSNSSGCFL